MFRRPRLIALLALLFALRAAVPVGYMLALPSGAAGGEVGLVFCPVQNSGLNLDRLTKIGKPAESQGHQHGHHGHRDTDKGNDYANVEVVGDCALWAGSTGAAPPPSAPKLPIALANERLPGPSAGIVLRRRGTLSAAPRAPPSC